uniref:non-specific serine/threonine protein kinase n=1 Tax=Hemiscolopendra marginata TaxID=943146 RepID=A0A646QG39_9MYRI
MIWFKPSGIGLIHKTILLRPPCNVLLWTQAINEKGMSAKIINRFLYHGRKLFQGIREKYSNITHNIKGDIAANVRDKGLLNATEQVSKQKYENPFFLNHLLKWATNTTAAEIRRNAAKKIIYGGRNAVPFLGFVGINLISGQGLVTKDDEIEKVCEDIRICLKNDAKLSENISPSVSLNDLEIGEVIAKGCNAVVHAGRWKNEYESNQETNNETSTDENLQDGLASKHSNLLERFHTFNLAVKMMFNYDAESNAFAILKAMHRETVPAKFIIGNISLGDRIPFKHYSLPPHPNIVSMHCAFTDSTPLLPEAIMVYPDALPYRLNRDGSGRNMTLFLVMKRYHCNLREYLKFHKPSPTTQLSLFTQLMEAIVHLTRNGVVHRDLKTDNILLDLTLGIEMPVLVITDFGNAYVNSNLKLPLHTVDVERGGNWALMAPEVKTTVPGPFTIIDYNKSDLWTAATLAYEIFGQNNPFYSGNKSQLESHSYSEEQLPEVPNLPKPLSLLLQDMLKRDPALRPSPAVAANVGHFLLWGPQRLLSKKALFSKDEMIEWLATEAAASILQGTLENTLWIMLRNLFLSRVRMKELKDALIYFC